MFFFFNLNLIIRVDLVSQNKPNYKRRLYNVVLFDPVYPQRHERVGGLNLKIELIN